jgi:hypothetical protein
MLDTLLQRFRGRPDLERGRLGQRDFFLGGTLGFLGGLLFRIGRASDFHGRGGLAAPASGFILLRDAAGHSRGQNIARMFQGRSEASVLFCAVRLVSLGGRAGFFVFSGGLCRPKRGIPSGMAACAVRGQSLRGGRRSGGRRDGRGVSARCSRVRQHGRPPSFVHTSTVGREALRVAPRRPTTGAADPLRGGSSA